MRRFDYDENDDYREDVDRFFSEAEIDPETYAEMQEWNNFEDIYNEEILNEIKMQLVSRDFHYKILRTSIKLAEKNFWWNFLSIKTRMNHIKTIYNTLAQLEMTTETFKTIDQKRENG